MPLRLRLSVTMVAQIIRIVFRQELFTCFHFLVLVGALHAYLVDDTAQLGKEYDNEDADALPDLLAEAESEVRHVHKGRLHYWILGAVLQG